MSDFLNAPLGVALGFAAGLLGVYAVGLPLLRWSDRRHQRRWQRQWTLQRQLREVEDKIGEEQLSDEERAWRQRYRIRQAAIRCEAQCCLGLPKEEDTP